MRVPPNRSSVPGFTARELRILASATRVYLDVLKDFDSWAANAAERAANPEDRALLDSLRADIRSTQQRRRVGTVASIGRLTATLLGEDA